MSFIHLIKTTVMETCFIFIFALLWFSSPMSAQKPRPNFLPFNNKNNILSLYDRMREPMFIAKEDVYFQMPLEYLPPEYQSMADEIAERFGSGENVQNIKVKPVTPPNLTIPLQLGRDESLSLFLPSHRKLAAKLIEIFMNVGSFEDFLSTAIFCRDRINPQLFVYALSVAILHRSDTSSILPPSLVHVFPERYVDASIFPLARTEANIVPPGSRIPLEIPRDYTASNKDPEHRVAYFREDIGVNLNYWQWYIVHPFEGPRYIVSKDRRGELSYYFHHQIMARYNFERLCNKLARTVPYMNWFGIVEEGYFSKLTTFVSSRDWAPRLAFTKLRDVNREDEHVQFNIADLTRWRERIIDGINLHRLINEQAEVVELIGYNGIEILGNAIESNSLSINREFYGDLRNYGQTAIGFSHDPDGRHLEAVGVMGDTATCMRDPAFYRWHAFIDDIFRNYKKTLPPYTAQQLSFKGIRITGLEVISENAPKNELRTFWRKHDIDLSKGLDFTPKGTLYVRTTMLDHAAFVYRIQVENTGTHRVGMVRIFLAPKLDEAGKPFALEDQIPLFVELDKFTVELKNGVSAFQRSSSDSSVSIPYAATYRNLYSPQNINVTQLNYSGCGWPQNMLIPKGSTEGYPAQLFVMISNYENDKVNQPPPVGYQQAYSYCGLIGRLYPDKQNMGYPFDRLPCVGVNVLSDFLTPNMRVLEVKIRHTNNVES